MLMRKKLNKVSYSKVEDYNVTGNDYLARMICTERGFTCEAMPLGNGKFQIGIYKKDELKLVRKLVWNYNEEQYAVHEAYRSLVNKIKDEPIIK